MHSRQINWYIMNLLHCLEWKTKFFFRCWCSKNSEFLQMAENLLFFACATKMCKKVYKMLIEIKDKKNKPSESVNVRIWTFDWTFSRIFNKKLANTKTNPSEPSTKELFTSARKSTETDTFFFIGAIEWTGIIDIDFSLQHLIFCCFTVSERFLPLLGNRKEKWKKKSAWIKPTFHNTQIQWKSHSHRNAHRKFYFKNSPLRS